MHNALNIKILYNLVIVIVIIYILQSTFIYAFSHLINIYQYIILIYIITHVYGCILFIDSTLVPLLKPLTTCMSMKPTIA